MGFLGLLLLQKWVGTGAITNTPLPLPTWRRSLRGSWETEACQGLAAEDFSLSHEPYSLLVGGWNLTG